MKKIVLILGLLLAACQTVVAPPPVYPQITFTNMKPFLFNVAQMEIVQEYKPSMLPPNVDHLFLITPTEAVRIWARDRITTKGVLKTMKVIIKDASVVEQQLPKTEGIVGLFTKDQAANYTAHLDVRLEIIGSDPLFPESEASIAVTRSKTIGEDASVNDRNALYYELTRGLISDFNTEAEKNIPLYMYKYLVN